VIVGTTRAVSLLQGTFRQARRTSDKGVLIWEPLPKGSELWEFFLEGLFKYQWTQRPITLTQRLADALHDLTQGIHALVICLFQLSQHEAISSGTESLSEGLFKKVASEQFKLVQPMLDALRSGNATQVDHYEDLMTSALSSLKGRVDDAVQVALLKEQVRSGHQCAAERIRTISALVTMGFTDEEVRPLVDRSFDEHPGTNSAVVIHQILSNLELPPLRQDGLEAEGLRSIVDGGARRGVSALDSLTAAGIIKDPHKR
jgi:hypothetical protein